MNIESTLPVLELTLTVKETTIKLNRDNSPAIAKFEMYLEDYLKDGKVIEKIQKGEEDIVSTLIDEQIFARLEEGVNTSVDKLRQYVKGLIK